MCDPIARFNRARITYNYCGICGRIPSSTEEPNRAPLRWWDCDDGYKIGSLCWWCFDEVCNDKPQPDDYAYRTTNHICDTDPETDEDPSLAL